MSARGKGRRSRTSQSCQRAEIVRARPAFTARPPPSSHVAHIHPNIAGFGVADQTHHHTAPLAVRLLLNTLRHESPGARWLIDLLVRTQHHRPTVFGDLAVLVGGWCRLNRMVERKDCRDDGIHVEKESACDEEDEMAVVPSAGCQVGRFRLVSKPKERLTKLNSGEKDDRWRIS
eukprot:SAG11_NODE_621_length_8169_cov_2.866914_3_plen_175_part_00